jgi:hypothetical protein
VDWADRYRCGNTPWDMGQPHPELTRRIEAGQLTGSRSVLVPGCGRGHDAVALAQAGLVVTALDLVDALHDELTSALGPHGGRFVAADALDFGQPHELLFEHTFFCALPPDQRPRYGEMAARCIGSGGELHAVVFPIDKAPADEGPPFQMSTPDLATALGAAFELIEDSPIPQVEGRAWGARWARFRRR